jgi:hypothetical protein
MEPVPLSALSGSYQFKTRQRSIVSSTDGNIHGEDAPPPMFLAPPRPRIRTSIIPPFQPMSPMSPRDLQLIEAEPSSALDLETAGRKAADFFVDHGINEDILHYEDVEKKFRAQRRYGMFTIL